MILRALSIGVAAWFLVVASATHSAAQIVELDFEGNAGPGLTPENVENGGAVGAPATGGEVGDGWVYNTDTNELDFDFEFAGLTGGLADVASGVHLHLVDAPRDPNTKFNDTGGIAFNLNANDPNVELLSPLLALDGSVTSGRVTGTAILDESQEALLFDGFFYINIHSGGFGGGELRGNLVAVPIPESVSAMLVVVAGCAIRGVCPRGRRS